MSIFLKCSKLSLVRIWCIEGGAREARAGTSESQTEWRLTASGFPRAASVSPARAQPLWQAAETGGDEEGSWVEKGKKIDFSLIPSLCGSQSSNTKSCAF